MDTLSRLNIRPVKYRPQTAFPWRAVHLFNLENREKNCLYFLWMCKFWVIDFFIRLAFTGLHVSTANDGQLEISQVEDPSGMWSSFIAEEGSLDRAQRIVHYLCERERGGV